MIYKPDFLLEEVQKYFSLEDGDIIMTGTPKGVGTISKGERFCGRIFAGEKLLVEHNWTVC